MSGLYTRNHYLTQEICKNVSNKKEREREMAKTLRLIFKARDSRQHFFGLIAFFSLNTLWDNAKLCLTYLFDLSCKRILRRWNQIFIIINIELETNQFANLPVVSCNITIKIWRLAAFLWISHSASSIFSGW